MKKVTVIATVTVSVNDLNDDDEITEAAREALEEALLDESIALSWEIEDEDDDDF